MRRTDSLEKTLMLGKIEGRRKRGWQDEMVGCHHWHNGHEFEQAPGVGDGQGSLACCSPWGCKESDTTEWLNWTDWWKHKRASGCAQGIWRSGFGTETLVSTQMPLPKVSYMAKLKLKWQGNTLCPQRDPAKGMDLVWDEELGPII